MARTPTPFDRSISVRSVLLTSKFIRVAGTIANRKMATQRAQGDTEITTMKSLRESPRGIYRWISTFAEMTQIRFGQNRASSSVTDGNPAGRAQNPFFVLLCLSQKKSPHEAGQSGVLRNSGRNRKCTISLRGVCIEGVEGSIR
jgi:hypothetical protein